MAEYFLGDNREDLQWVKATCFSLNRDGEFGQFKKQTVNLKIDTATEAEGRYKTAFRCVQKDSPFKFVAKELHGCQSVDDLNVEEVMRKMALVQEFADEFNSKLRPGAPRIDFITPRVVEMEDSSGNAVIFMVEDYLEGEFINRSQQDSNSSSEYQQIPEAFSHFSFQHSNCNFIITNIQGVGCTYTEPQIIYATQDESDFISEFFATHKCNKVCDYLEIHK